MINASTSGQQAGTLHLALTLTLTLGGQQVGTLHLTLQWIPPPVRVEAQAAELHIHVPSLKRVDSQGIEIIPNEPVSLSLHHQKTGDESKVRTYRQQA